MHWYLYVHWLLNFDWYFLQKYYFHWDLSYYLFLYHNRFGLLYSLDNDRFCLLLPLLNHYSVLNWNLNQYKRFFLSAKLYRYLNHTHLLLDNLLLDSGCTCDYIFCRNFQKGELFLNDFHRKFYQAVFLNDNWNLNYRLFDHFNRNFKQLMLG